jgi:hypothetical protein
MAIRRRAHLDRINTYILVWPGDEPEQIGFDGEVWWLPGKDETAKPDEVGSRYRMESARSEGGDLIAGTIRVADRWATIEGNKVKVFDADTFVRWIESVREDLLNRGLYIVDFPHEVDQAMAEGRPIWEKSQDGRARTILETELFRRRKWEEKGTPAPPSSSEHLVVWAIKHLNDRGTALSLVATEDIMGALSGATAARRAVGNLAGLTPTPSPTMPQVAGGARAPAPPKLRGIPGGNELYALAKTLGVKMTKDELEGLLGDDIEAIKSVGARVQEKQKQQEELAEDAKESEAAAAP